MTISLPRKTRANLVDAIAAGLRESQILSGSYVLLDPKCWNLHKAIPAGSQKEQQLRLIAGDRHVSDFVRSEIARASFGKFDLKARPLTLELTLGLTGCASLSESLVTGIESLPWTYKFYSELAGEFETSLLGRSGELTLTPTFRLLSGRKLAHELPGANTLSNLAGGLGHAGWNLESIYAELAIEGFVANDLESATIQDATDYLVSFYGLSLALGLVSPGNAWINVRAASCYGLTIFKENNDAMSHIARVEFDPSHAKALHDLGISSLPRDRDAQVV